MTDNPDEFKDPQAGANGKMSLVGHLQELRKRLIICLAAVAVASSACYFYAVDMVHMITVPAGKLYYLHPAEAFFTYLKVAVFAGFLVALPVILYHIWAFIVPAMTRRERKASIILVPASIALFFAGLSFSYYLVLPAGIKFFVGFGSADLQPLFSIGQYVSFVISFLLPFGFIFELPLLISVASKLGLVNSEFLRKKRKIVLVMSFVFGALLAPSPDVFSQTMVALPMIILYEASILIVRYILKK